MTFPFPHTVTVQTYLGEGSDGPVYATAVTGVQCLVVDRIKRVTDPTGTEVVSSTTVDTPVENVALFPPGSRVTCLGQDPAIVITRSKLEAGPAFLAVQHVEVNLT